MARAKKLKPAAVRKIFSSTDPAPPLAKQFGVSTNLIYLIRQGRIHKKITGGLASPAPVKRTKGKTDERAIDLDALADAIIDRLVARLRTTASR